MFQFCIIFQPTRLWTQTSGRTYAMMLGYMNKLEVLRTDHSRSIGDRVRSFFRLTSSSKRALTSPEAPRAKLTRSSSLEIPAVSLFLADLSLSSPEDLAVSMGCVTHSKGPAANVPNINFPVESQASQKRLADLNNQAASRPREDAAAGNSPQSSPSTVPDVAAMGCD